VLGPQRCGKSNLIAYMLLELSSVVIFDSSHHPDEWAKWGPQHGYVVSSDPADILRHPKVVHQVAMQSLMDVSGWRQPGSQGDQWTQALRNVVKRGNTATVFDEIVHQLPAGRPHPDAMVIYTQGAKYGLTPWAGTQFGNRVETATIRAATHAFCFRMNPYDLGLVAQRRGCPTEGLATLDKYAFGYHLTNTARFQLCAPVERVM
jgi:hypothetical protein